MKPPPILICILSSVYLVALSGCATDKHPSSSRAIEHTGNEQHLSGIPQELRERLNASHLLDSWEVYRSTNHLYLRGDFDGDGKRDYAVWLKAKHRDAFTIAFLFGDGKMQLSSSEKELDDMSPLVLCEWWLHPQKERVASRTDLNEEHRAPHLQGDAIDIDKPESSAILIYWAAGHLRIYYLSD